VGVNASAANPHYSPSQKSKLIRKNNLVLIDIWAREKQGVFADITWMAYTGKNIPEKIKNTFDHVINARDMALDFIRKELKKKNFPIGKEVDEIVRGHLDNLGLGKYFIHGTGHSLGNSSCHGKAFNFNKKSKSKIKTNTPFTIEPGVYFKSRFGIRSEINCYITEDYKLKVTTEKQNDIARII